jgi:hypothetical protein
VIIALVILVLAVGLALAYVIAPHDRQADRFRQWHREREAFKRMGKR